MAGWHSLSGTLQYKSGNNALGRLITKRKVWCVLEESLCQLHYYKCEEDVHKHRSSQGHIDLNGAAISLDLEHQNQFVILSDGKEHIFTAENHESMMIWLLGLQAKRDLHSHKVSKSSGSSTNAYSAKQCNYETWSSRPSLFLTSDQLQNAGGCMTQNSRSTPSLTRKGFHWEIYEQHSLDSGSLVYKRRYPDPEQLMSSSRSRSLPPVFEGLESSRSFPPPCQQGPHKLEQSKFRSSSQAMLHQDSDSDDVFGGENIGPLRSRKSAVSRNWQKVQSAVIGQVMNSNRLPLESISSEMDLQRRSASYSSRSASSDSAIERGEGTPQELSARLSELERELISTKCELAKVMNRQSSYQELLHQKEDTIKQLEVHSCSSSVQNGDSKEIEKKSSPPKKAEKEFQEKIRVLQNQNRFLNEEVKKLAKIRLQEHGRYQEQNLKLQSLEAEIEKWKMDYVCLIQSSIRYPGEEGVEDLELCLYGGDKHKKRVQALLDEARKINPRLPTYESLANNEVHVDVYGFKHVYTNTGLLLHYLCTELTYHYLVQAGVYEEHQKKWTVFMRQHGKAPMKCVNELKVLCRGGIPDRFRKQMWRKLVHFKVRDIIKDKGDYYYRNICNMLPESPLAACYRKQVSLDLMRTMPSNVKFSSAGSKGIMDLQDVLLAFCVHNPTIGYCQGMNFIVGMSLLFMEAEDAFWTLVALAERYFSPHYFDHSLIGAQSDQQVLKDIVREKLPTLCNHLEGIDIELSTITLNWFLAVFFDAVPFQTLLRVWDCFLLEGPKVLFRFSLAILKLHERDILQKTDTMGIMRHLKACAKLTYDVEGLVKLAFEGLKPFPKRRDILTKETCYLNALKEKHKKKELQRLAFAEREQLYMSMEAEAGIFMGIECAVAILDGKVWFCYGDQHIGRLCYVSCEQGTMCSIDYKLDSRLMCMCTMGTDKLVLGTISWMLVSLDVTSQEQVWQIQLHDAILSVCCYEDEDVMATRIFSGLADGTVAVTEKQYNKSEPNVDVMYIPIGQAPVTCLMLQGDQVWCASGNTVAVIHVKTLDAMDTFSVSVNPYDHILSLVPSVYGIWISLRGSSILELWDPQTLNCRMLYDTRTDRYPQLRKEDDTYFNRARITSTLAKDNTVWVGTGEGNLIIYEIVESAQLKTPTEHSPTIDTSSNVSCIVRPDKKKELCSMDISERLQGVYDKKQESELVSELQRYNEDHCLNDTEQPSECMMQIYKTMRRRSSSENDMRMLQASRYASDGLATMDLENNRDHTQGNNLSQVTKLLLRTNSSENDLEKLSVKQTSVNVDDFVDDNEEEELEQALEAQARRESLTILLDSNSVGKECENRSHLSSESRSGKETGSSRRSSVEVMVKRKSSLTPKEALTVRGDHYKSDDSGCETRSRSTRLKTSESSSRRSSKSGKKVLVQIKTSNFDFEGDVFEAELEKQARRESLVNVEVERKAIEHLVEKLEQNGYSDFASNTNRVNGPFENHLNDSVNSGSAESDNEDFADSVQARIDTEERLECDARHNSNIALGIDNLEDSYLSSSPSMSFTPEVFTPDHEQVFMCRKLDHGRCVDKDLADSDNDDANKVEVNKSNTNSAVTNGTDTEASKEKVGQPHKRQLSVIEDISVLCPDCKALETKCSECSKLLTGQELLRINERRLSHTENGDSDVSTGDKHDLLTKCKQNGVKKLMKSDRDSIETMNTKNKTCLKGIFTSRKSSTDDDVAVGADDIGGLTDKDGFVVSADSSYGLLQRQLNKQTSLKDGKESHISESLKHGVNMFVANNKDGYFKESVDKSSMTSTEDPVAKEQVKMFPGEKNKHDLTRQEKVGYWLSSLSKTRSLSNDADDIIAEGHKGHNGIAYGNSSQGDGTQELYCAHKCDVDPEEEVFYNAEETLNDCNGAERPKTLNIASRLLAKHKHDNKQREVKLTQVQGIMRNVRIGSGESDGSSGTTRKSSERAVNKKDPGIQYRLDFSGVTVETDSEFDPTTPRASVGDCNLQSLAKMSQNDSRKNSLDLGTIQENCKRLETEHKKTVGVEKNVEKSLGRNSERQRIFEFLKTPSLASRHMSLGLKIIDDDMEWTELYSMQYSTPSPTSSTEQRMADFLRTPSISSKPSSLWSSYENISTPSHLDIADSKLLRPTHLNRGHLSHSASTASIGSDNDLIYNVDLNLEAKVKISDKPVKCLLATSCKNEPIIMSFSGSFGDDEAVLKWRKHQNEQLWTNEPIMELCPRTRTAILPSYMRRRLSSNSSFQSHGSGESAATFLSSGSQHR